MANCQIGLSAVVCEVFYKINQPLWFAKNASGAKTHVSTSIASRSRELGRRMWGT
jgi:hypothetical protein